MQIYKEPWKFLCLQILCLQTFFSSMISEKIIDLCGNVKMTIDILKGTKF